jgi:selenium-binding protein 1
MAMQAPPETLAYVAMLNPRGGPDALLTLDTRAETASYGSVVSRVDMTAVGDELHHFGWNACSSGGIWWCPG